MPTPELLAQFQSAIASLTASLQTICDTLETTQQAKDDTETAIADLETVVAECLAVIEGDPEADVSAVLESGADACRLVIDQAATVFLDGAAQIQKSANELRKSAKHL